MARVKFTKEVAFKKFDELTKKGIKLTKKNLDSADPKLYNSAVNLFGSWMECKREYYVYQEEAMNPERNLERIVIKKAEEIEEKTGLKIVVDEKLNPEFTSYVEGNEPFVMEIVKNTFGTWDNFGVKYNKLATPAPHVYTESEMMKEIVSAITDESIIKENVFSKKYSDIYNTIIEQYGSLKDGLLHFLNEYAAAKE